MAKMRVEERKMIKKLKLLLIPSLIFLGILLWLLFLGEQESGIVREQVVRYHVVANSDSEEDQKIKLLLRDHLFASIEDLFKDCKDAESALQTAKASKERLEAEGEEYLRSIGAEEQVKVSIGPCFFPTKTYGSLSFPAGEYRAVRVQIGEGKGENFWCVLYPALCLSPAVSNEEGEQKMAFAVGEGPINFMQKEGQIQAVKFQLVEWFEILRNKIKNS